MAFVKKPQRKRQYRQRDNNECEIKKETKEQPFNDEQHEDSDTHRLANVLDDIRDLQRMRQKSAGLSAAELALGREINRDVELIVDDPLKLKTGGVIDLKRLKKSELDAADIEEGIKQQFSKESHLRDEDEEMRKFVDEGVQRHAGKKFNSNADSSKTESAGKDEKQQHPGGSGLAEDMLFQRAADKLKKYQSNASEEMLSNEMLSGIPEVDLGVTARIKNIEETEAMKQRLLREAIEKKKDLDRATKFNQDVVKDLSASYVQHNKYEIDSTTAFGREDADVPGAGPSGSGETEVKVKRPPTEKVPIICEDTPRLVDAPQPKKEIPSNFRPKKFEYVHKPVAAPPNDGTEAGRGYWFPQC